MLHSEKSDPNTRQGQYPPLLDGPWARSAEQSGTANRIDPSWGFGSNCTGQLQSLRRWCADGLSECRLRWSSALLHSTPDSVAQINKRWTLCDPRIIARWILLSSQFWPMWSKSRRGLGQLPIGQSTLSGWVDGWDAVSHCWSPLLTSTGSAKIGKTAIVLPTDVGSPL